MMNKELTMTQITLAQAQAAQTLEFPSWEEMSDVEQLHTIWWDAYKDAFGFRPRGQEVSHFTAEDFQRELTYLGTVIEREEAARREAEKGAAQDFEARIGEMIALGAKTRETALRWMHMAAGTDGDDEYLCYKNGLPYGYFKKAA
jgi:hypothetical protein